MSHYCLLLYLKVNNEPSNKKCYDYEYKYKKVDM